MSKPVGLYRIKLGNRMVKGLYTKFNANRFCEEHGIDKSRYELILAVEKARVISRGTYLHVDLYEDMTPKQSDLF